MNGRPVRLAPRSPGAKPTISKGASAGPKDGTGALCQPSNLPLLSARKVARRGHRSQSGAGLGPAVNGITHTHRLVAVVIIQIIVVDVVIVEIIFIIVIIIIVVIIVFIDFGMIVLVVVAGPAFALAAGDLAFQIG